MSPKVRGIKRLATKCLQMMSRRRGRACQGEYNKKVYGCKRHGLPIKCGSCHSGKSGGAPGWCNSGALRLSDTHLAVGIWKNKKRHKQKLSKVRAEFLDRREIGADLRKFMFMAFFFYGYPSTT